MDEETATKWKTEDVTFFFCSIDCEGEVRAEPAKWLALAKMPAVEQAKHAHGHGHHEAPAVLVVGVGGRGTPVLNQRTPGVSEAPTLNAQRTVVWPSKLAQVGLVIDQLKASTQGSP